MSTHPAARAALVLVTSLLACAPAGPSTRSLHYIDDQLVYSSPVSARAYEAYLRARLAMESVPPNVDEAREAIRTALRYDPDEPQLWTTRAEIEMRAGNVDEAVASLRHALELAPGYPPASTMLARVGGPQTAARPR